VCLRRLRGARAATSLRLSASEAAMQERVPRPASSASSPSMPASAGEAENSGSMSLTM
jgi:hypothetical protein